MDEITRFLQLRPAQSLADEQKLQTGLPLYPDNNLSEFGNNLRKSMHDKSDYKAIIKRFKAVNQGKNLIVELNQIHPIMLALYKWLDFKARPIKIADFELFVQTLEPNKKSTFIQEWISYADNFILAIYFNDLSSNYCIDFQLLIRAIYIYKLCIGYKANHYVVTGTEALLNELLTLPILIPEGLIHSRCNESCLLKGRIELPDLMVIEKMSATPNCECECDENCKNPSNYCLCLRTYIADLFIVKEELVRYEEGDIADIENILAGEMKVRRHRNLLKTEETTELETETVTSEEKDHQVSEKFSLQSEVKSTVDSKVNVDAGVTATLKYGSAITITPHANVTANYSKSESKNNARSYAKDVIDRSVVKIQEKVRKLQISKAISEWEERNKHSIDNTEAGSDHRAGIYYWVNKVTHAQVFNYGEHMMFDVIVPEPAAIFRKLYKLKIENSKKENEPQKPDIAPKSIKRNNYGDILKQYAISTTEECQPPDEYTAVQVAFSHNVTEPDSDHVTGFSSNDFKSPQIPEGYEAVSSYYDVRCSTGHAKGTGSYDEIAVHVNVGKKCILAEWANEYDSSQSRPLPNKNWKTTGTVAMNGEEGIITVALAGFTTVALALSGTVSIKCKITDVAFEKWQVKIYNLVMDDYNRKLEIYKSGDTKEEELIQIKGRNPFLNREIERNEFKRNIIAMLLCNYFNGIGSMMERVSPCGYPEIDFQKLEREAPIIQFFEQVFEWNYVTYLFYHSMWARKCKWPELIDEDSGDALFDKFLMSGAARVQIPVRPGMEEIFSWFLKTGQIWGASGIPPVSGDDEYVSMIQEVKESKQCDYTDRNGLIEAIQGSDRLKLTGSTYYWDFLNNKINSLKLENDIDREILVDFEIYRIVKIEQDNPADNSSWNITVNKPYEGNSAVNLKHAVGALYVGAPWEITIPTKLVYLRNNTDKLPVYPLT